jgi:hypothetical protein
MLFVTNSIQVIQWIPHQEFGDFRTGGQVICTVKHADEFVPLAEEEMVLQGMIDRLIEIRRCYGMEVLWINVR